MKYFIIFYHCLMLSILVWKKFSSLNSSMMSFLYGLMRPGSIECDFSTIEAKNSVKNSFITLSLGCTLGEFL